MVTLAPLGARPGGLPATGDGRSGGGNGGDGRGVLRLPWVWGIEGEGFQERVSELHVGEEVDGKAGKRALVVEVEVADRQRCFSPSILATLVQARSRGLEGT